MLSLSFLAPSKSSVAQAFKLWRKRNAWVGLTALFKDAHTISLVVPCLFWRESLTFYGQNCNPPTYDYYHSLMTGAPTCAVFFSIDMRPHGHFCLDWPAMVIFPIWASWIAWDDSHMTLCQVIELLDEIGSWNFLSGMSLNHDPSYLSSQVTRSSGMNLQCFVMVLFSNQLQRHHYGNCLCHLFSE
jgi:hypothetical protein